MKITCVSSREYRLGSEKLSGDVSIIYVRNSEGVAGGWRELDSWEGGLGGKSIAAGLAN